MSRTMTRLMAAGLVAVALLSFASIAGAAPSDGAFALKNAAPSNIETVRWVGFWGGGWGRGWGVGAGLATGAVVGGLIAAPYWYGGYYGGGGGGGVQYCMQRYRTYDPRTGTFIGNDGRPHPCP